MGACVAILVSPALRHIRELPRTASARAARDRLTEGCRASGARSCSCARCVWEVIAEPAPHNLHDWWQGNRVA